MDTSKGRIDMKTKLGFVACALALLFSVSVIGGSLTAFAQPDERVPYFGLRGFHEAIYHGVEFAIDWEIGNWLIVESGPGPDLPFYIFQIEPRAQIMISSEWWFGVSVFNQYRTNHPGHYVCQPEFFIRHEW